MTPTPQSYVCLTFFMEHSIKALNIQVEKVVVSLIMDLVTTTITTTAKQNGSNYY